MLSNGVKIFGKFPTNKDVSHSIFHKQSWSLGRCIFTIGIFTVGTSEILKPSYLGTLLFSYPGFLVVVFFAISTPLAVKKCFINK